MFIWNQRTTGHTGRTESESETAGHVCVARGVVKRYVNWWNKKGKTIAQKEKYDGKYDNFGLDFITIAVMYHDRHK